MNTLTVSTEERINDIRKDTEGNFYLNVDGSAITFTLVAKTGEIKRQVVGDAYIHDKEETIKNELNAYAALVQHWLSLKG